MTLKEIIMPIIAAAATGGGFAALIMWWRFRRKDVAEANKVQAEAKRVSAEADSTIADGFKKLMAIQEAELFKKISQVEDMERILRLNKDELRKAELAFVEKESTYQKMILELTAKVHQLETEIKKFKQ